MRRPTAPQRQCFALAGADDHLGYQRVHTREFLGPSAVTTRPTRESSPAARAGHGPVPSIWAWGATPPWLRSCGQSLREVISARTLSYLHLEGNTEVNQQPVASDARLGRATWSTEQCCGRGIGRHGRVRSSVREIIRTPRPCSSTISCCRNVFHRGLRLRNTWLCHLSWRE